MSDELRYFPSEIAVNISISSSLTTVGNTDAILFFDKINLIANSVMFNPLRSAIGLNCSTFSSADFLHSAFLSFL